MSRKRVNLPQAETCVKCGEDLPAGMTAYALSGDAGEGYEHYGKCKGQQKSDYKAAALKTLGLDEETLLSMSRLVEYLYRDAVIGWINHLMQDGLHDDCQTCNNITSFLQRLEAKLQ